MHVIICNIIVFYNKRTRTYNSRIVIMLYDDELYMLKSNTYVMLCNYYFFSNDDFAIVYCIGRISLE